MDPRLITIGQSAITSISEAIYRNSACRAALRDAAHQFIAWLNSAEPERPASDVSAELQRLSPDASVQTPPQATEPEAAAPAPPPPPRETRPMRLPLGDEE